MSLTQSSDQDKLLDDFFKKEVLVRLMFCACGFIVSSGLITNYAMYAMRVTPVSERHMVFVGSIEILMSIASLITILAVIFNLRINYRFRNLRKFGRHENPWILYVFCLPMFLMTTIGIVLVMVIDAMHIECPNLFFNITDICYCFVVACNFFSVIVLIVDISGRSDTGEEWILNFMNLFTSISTITSLWTQVFYNVIMKVTDGFADVEYHAHGVNFKEHCSNDTVANSVFANFSGFIHFKIEAIIIAMIIFTPYLIMPIKQHLRLLLRNTTVMRSFHSRGQREGPLFSIPAVMSACVLISIYGLSLGMLMNNRTLETKILHHVVTLILSVFGILMNLLAINDTIHWDRKYFNGFFHFSNLIIYFGMIGHYMTKVADILIDINDYRDLSNLGYIVENMLQLVIITVQVTLVSLIYERRPRRPAVNSWCFFFSPILFLIVLNITFYIDEYFLSLYEVSNHAFQIRLTLMGLISFGRPFIYLYKTQMIATMIRVYVNMYSSGYE